MNFTNVYNDRRRANSYATLEFPGTYYLAFRDIPEIVGECVSGKNALDFGCGAGRSTRFLKGLGFNAVGVDISAEMLAHARSTDPDGDYRLVPDGDLSGLADASFDLIASLFTFDNIAAREHKTHLFRSLRRKLRPTGRLINVVSSPEIYRHEWHSFSTEAFPENRRAADGDPVRIIMTDVDDRRPVVDILCSDRTYREIFAEANLQLLSMRQPLGRSDEPFAWKSETQTPPWTIYVLAP